MRFALPFLALALRLTAPALGTETPPAATQPVEITAERGPVRVTVRAEKNRILVAEPLRVTINVTAESGVDVNPPVFPDELGEFQLRDSRPGMPTPADGRRRWEHSYELDAYLAGEHELPGVTIGFTDRRAADSAPIEAQVTTDPIKIEVQSVLAQVDPSRKIDIKGPVAIPVPRDWFWLWWLAAGVAIVGGAATAFILARRRRRRILMARAVPPHELAFIELRRLADERLIESGRTHAFYFRLSDILRQYIERRFRLMAPERTTQEFLAEVREHPSLSAGHQTLLADFLEAADRVKFALHEPVRAEADSAFAAAEGFVRETSARAEPAGEPALEAAVA